MLVNLLSNFHATGVDVICSDWGSGNRKKRKQGRGLEGKDSFHIFAQNKRPTLCR